ncbi:MAG: hypothetical protein KTR16_05035 [Acidiferrobacterales bacterium]|nr:hypothetical protein [Acidiferrobacterales bacterium]
MNNKLIIILLLATLFSGCASKFPNPKIDAELDKEISAAEIFDRTFQAHGGASLDQLNDVNLSLSGEWKRLITRIQPLVTDFKYRVDSQERLYPNSGGYVALYDGPSGSKKVVRTPESLEVYYNDNQSTDPEVLSSTALTADAFHLFLLGPLALDSWRTQFTRLTDIDYQGQNYYRLHLYRKPGFGYSEVDQVVLWVDQNSGRTKMVQITLEGHSTTQGAHVEVEYLAYIQQGAYLFPSRFFERVNAPIAIDAHAWHLTGLDINRGNEISNYSGRDKEPIANYPATPFK